MPSRDRDRSPYAEDVRRLAAAGVAAGLTADAIAEASGFRAAVIRRWAKEYRGAPADPAAAAKLAAARAQLAEARTAMRERRRATLAERRERRERLEATGDGPSVWDTSPKYRRKLPENWQWAEEQRERTPHKEPSVNTETRSRIKAHIYRSAAGYRWEIATEAATLREGRADTAMAAAVAASEALRAARRIEGGMR